MILNASIDVTTLVEQLKKGHTSCSRSDKNQHYYANVTIWVDPEKDPDWKQVSVQLNSSKDGREKDKAMNGGKDVYIGNGRVQKSKNEPAKAGEFDLPGAAPNDAAAGGTFTPPQANDDLPF
jgi:hypothetical protein